MYVQLYANYITTPLKIPTFSTVDVYASWQFSIGSEVWGRKPHMGKYHLFQDVDTVSILYEGTNETDIFWSALGGRKTYNTNADFMNVIRLFR